MRRRLPSSDRKHKMTSATARTRSMTNLPFVSQLKNCSTLLWLQLQKPSPKQLEVRWTVSVYPRVSWTQ